MAQSPITWVPPKTFDKDAPDGMGLPRLDAAEHVLIYDPAPSKGNVDEGGDGKYESLVHGTFNHHQRIVLYRDKFIAFWTNHSRDENGPGMRVLARVGTFDAKRENIDFDGNGTFVELAPPPVPIRRRVFQHDRQVVYPYAIASLELIISGKGGTRAKGGPGLPAEENIVGDGLPAEKADCTLLDRGRLYVTGHIIACHGYVRQEANRRPTGPLPTTEWQDDLDVEAGFFFDVWYNLGLAFVQRWRIEGNTMVPDSPMYHRTPLVTEVEVTPGRVKKVAPLLPPYTKTIPFEQAPADIRADITEGTHVVFERRLRYAPDTAWLSADGKHALAHGAEFRRPDGKWVAVRDNLLNHGHYYAALKDREEDYYPPAAETNLWAGANMACGELPDGTPWILCNSYDDYFGAADRSRKDMYIALSRDGITFDRTFLLLHIDRKPDGGVYKFGGPQYFKAAIIGPNMWIVYSITKEKIGLTKVPVAALAYPK